MKKLLVLSLLLLLTGCISLPKILTPSKSVNKPAKSVSKSKVVKQDTQKSNIESDDLLFYLLRKEYAYWRGTPYRLGGNSKKGIDCSGFVQNVFNDSFNVKLPRTTATQVKEGFLVYKNQLQVGDLVFFKTGWRTRHVGIYIGDDKFIHASTSKGVMTSSLNNVYWKKKYWQSRRILE